MNFMLATANSGRSPLPIESLTEGAWAFDLKVDGIRCQLDITDTRVALTNRNGVDITERFPEIAEAAVSLMDNVLLDGEILAVDGTFSSTATRDKQGAAGLARFPCTYVAFDLLRAWRELRAEPWDVRRGHLDSLIDSTNPIIRTTPWSTDRAFVDMVKQMGGEGVIAKRVGSPYVNGRSQDWIKFKNVHTLSCLVSGYTEGTGSRKDFGAMQLVLLDPGVGLVPVGRVGTGFTQNTITTLKTALDRHEVLVVEIECLNRTATNQLRFPVFKGIRTDLTPGDCTVDQLTTIPTY